MASRYLSLLVIGSDSNLVHALSEALAHEAEVIAAPTIAAAREQLRRRLYDVVTLEPRLPNADALDLLGELTQRNNPPVFIKVPPQHRTQVVDFQRPGIDVLMIQPVRLDAVTWHLERIARQVRQRDLASALRQQLGTAQWGNAELIGSSHAIQQVREFIAHAAEKHHPVLLQGEIGTGKGLVARLIHNRSPRSAEAYAPVDCAGVPADRLEAILFGTRCEYAQNDPIYRRGLVSIANEGTLYLDEVDRLPMNVQRKLHDFLKSRRGMRVGDADAYPSNVRVIASTRSDLRQLVKEGRFDEDLLRLLIGGEIHLPPLRMIRSDLQTIARHLLHTLPVPGAVATGFTPLALEAMLHYDWPGNVMELRAVVERGLMYCEEPLLDAQHLAVPSPPPANPAIGSVLKNPELAPAELAHVTLAQMEWLMIQVALNASNGNKAAAAKSLGISVRTLYNKLDAHAP